MWTDKTCRHYFGRLILPIRMRIARRYENIVPQQSLFLMNSPFIIAQSEQMLSHCTASAWANAGDCYTKIFQRPPKTEAS